MLDERKLKILNAIINSYIATAEPIGSRTVTKQYDLGVSPATIRNEMSDLEDLGYLNKPHSSAGRVPSDKAYRLYVNEILRLQGAKIDLNKKNKIKSILLKESMEIEQLLQNSAKILSALTSYTAFAISPKLKSTTIKHIQLVPLDNNQILMVLVNNTGTVKNSILKTGQEIPENQLNTLSNILNDKLRGLSLGELDQYTFNNIIKEIFEYKSILDNIIPIIIKAMEDIDTVDLYSEGLTKILDFPEYKDLEKAKSIISFIEDKDSILEILLNNSLNGDIEITIGNENPYKALRDSSVITANYQLGDKIIGKIGIIGPTRMDYLQLINTLHLFSVNISEIIDKLFGI